MYPYTNNTKRENIPFNRTNYLRNQRNGSNTTSPYLANLNGATVNNTNFRTIVWTGKKMQLAVMSIPRNESIGVEMHPDNDQFFYVEQGQGVAMMGEDKEYLGFSHNIFPGFAIIVPAGKWHDIKNTGKGDLKLYTIYAPPHHPKGTVQPTKKQAADS